MITSNPGFLWDWEANSECPVEELPGSGESLLISSRTPYRSLIEARESEAKTISNWMLGEFARLLNATDTRIEDSKVTPKRLVELLDLIEEGVLSTTMAKAVFEEMFHTGRQAAQIVAEQGLTQISEAHEIDEIVGRVLAENTKAVADFEAGKEQALTFLVGQVMRATRGRANPKLVNNLLRERLKKK